MLAALTVTMMTASSIRSTFGVCIKPLEAEFGRSRGALGAALAGWIFEATGACSSAFASAAVLALVAAGLTLLIREEPMTARPAAVTA